MKQCPKCSRTYYDETLNFCLDDGEWLQEISGPDEPATAILADAGLPGESPTRVIDPQTTAPPVSPTHSEIPANTPLRANKMAWIVGALAVAIVFASVFGYRYYSSANAKQIESIAVMPFQNRSDDPDTDYLSDGLAESLIFRLSQLPGLKVSPASSAIRYKGRETDIEKMDFPELDMRAAIEAFTEKAYGRRMTFEHK